MPLFKRPRSKHWQIRFEIAGIEVKRSAGTTDRRAAQELEEQLRRDTWRQIKLGERRYTWGEAVAKFRLERGAQKSFERTERSLASLAEDLTPETLLSEITYDSLLTLRSILELRTVRGHNWSSKRPWSKATVNRVLAVVAAILSRAASDDWKMLERAPNVPLFTLPKKQPKWITREEAHALLGRFPPHTRDMMVMALATGLRKSNIAGLEWDRIDLERRCCYIPGHLTKSGEPIAVPLNEDAIAVLERWQLRHGEMRERWSAAAHRFVFVFRGRAPIKQLTTRMWRRECKAVGLEGVTFHTMRHSWASWQVQAGTPLKHLQELGGWASLEMPMRYAHLSPGHLAEYADRSLLGPDPRALSGAPDAQRSEGATQPVDLTGKGGTRTLDPGIMSAVL